MVSFYFIAMLHTGQTKEENLNLHQREVVQSGPGNCFQHTHSVFPFLFFLQMRVKVLTRWRLTYSCRLCSAWPLSPSATPSAPSESKFRCSEQSSFCAQSKLPFGFSRFHEILKTLTDGDEGRLHILKVVYDVWRNHPQVHTELSYHQQLLEAAEAYAGVTPVHFLTDDLSPGGQNGPDADNGLRRCS